MAEAADLPRTGALARFVGPFATAPNAVQEELYLAELVPPAMLSLRGRPEDGAFLRKAGAVLGCRLPTQPNSVQTAAETTVLWLGPDEWLVVAALGAEATLVSRLEQAMADIDAATCDVSGQRARLRLAGVRAIDVLAKGCPLDLHPSVFPTGACAQTVLARSTLLLHRLDDAPSFDLYPRRSFAEYVWHWLVDAMAEYGGRVVDGSAPAGVRSVEP
jgi:sarcosine oxidase subunit gamma